MIRYAILGLLSWHPFTGYDLKKIFTDSAALYWSGNNNQIYTTLLQLQRDGLVESELQPGLPAKKIYTLTGIGRKELRRWVQSNPEPPELRATFLIQLSWADQLSAAEVDALLERYESEVNALLLIEREKIRRGLSGPKRTPRETLLWERIAENITSTYEKELVWAGRLRADLAAQAPTEEG